MCFSKSYTDSTKIIIGPYLVGPGFDDSLFGREWSVGLVGWGGGIICYDKVCLGLHLVNILQIASARMQFFLSVILVPTNPAARHCTQSLTSALCRKAVPFSFPISLYVIVCYARSVIGLVLFIIISQFNAQGNSCNIVANNYTLLYVESKSSIAKPFAAGALNVGDQ